jgi:hypothetical protein
LSYQTKQCFPHTPNSGQSNALLDLTDSSFLTKQDIEGQGYICNATHAWHHGQRRVHISLHEPHHREQSALRVPLLSAPVTTLQTPGHFYQRNTNSISLITCLPFRETPPPQRKFITRGRYPPVHSLTEPLITLDTHTRSPRLCTALSPEVATSSPRVTPLNQSHLDSHNTAATIEFRPTECNLFNADHLCFGFPQIRENAASVFEQGATHSTLLTQRYERNMDQTWPEVAYPHLDVPQIGWGFSWEPVFPFNDQATIQVSIIHLYLLRRS